MVYANPDGTKVPTCTCMDLISAIYSHGLNLAHADTVLCVHKQCTKKGQRYMDVHSK